MLHRVRRFVIGVLKALIYPKPVVRHDDGVRLPPAPRVGETRGYPWGA